MSYAESILNSVRKMPLHRALRGCFLNRALKTYCKRVAVADEAALVAAFPEVSGRDLKNAARYIVSRLEAASTRGTRLDDDALLEDIAQHAANRELVRHLMLRSVNTYSKHIAQMPAERIHRSLRGIEAAHWQQVAQDVHDGLLYILAFNEVSPASAR
ncbi:hypothetical protein [Achromobacter ruhlandii]|uniref:hypothetical protein n=1 Tax=Achromobacter ruhlandii TaxID=72557 RepID=UPI003BA17081